jgi:hypothetical protein
MVRHDHPLYQRVQLELIESATGSLAHTLHPLTDARRLPRGHIRLGSALPERDPREAHDVSFLRGQG